MKAAANPNLRSAVQLPKKIKMFKNRIDNNICIMQLNIFINKRCALYLFLSQSIMLYRTVRILLLRESNGAVCPLFGVVEYKEYDNGKRSTEYRMRLSGEGNKEEQTEDKGYTEKK